nr:THUMP domain containing protein [Ipomoea batatas]
MPGAANGEYPDSSENKDSGCKNEISAAIKDIGPPNSVVDLKHPESYYRFLGFLMGQTVVGVSFFQRDWVCTKPRLSVKALVAEYKGEGWEKKPMMKCVSNASSK